MGAWRGLPEDSQRRARRWDVVLVGSGIASLVTAARLGSAGIRTLILEEAKARDALPGLREPFSLGGPGGLLDATLRELQLPLIDRRRLVPRELTHQVIADDIRMDVGPPGLTASEWVAWGLAKPETAKAAVAALAAGTPDAGRAFDALSNENARLGHLLATQARALSNAARVPAFRNDETQRVLLQGTLRGGFGFEDAPPWLVGILRRRVESLGVEFRSLRGRFEFVEARGEAGVSVESTGELWLGRTLVLTAPDAVLGRALEEGAPTGPLDLDRPAIRRHVFAYQVPQSLLPEAMAPSLVLAGDEDDPSPVAVSVHRGVEGARSALLVARRILAGKEPLQPLADAILDRLIELMPSARDALAPRDVELPEWDDDDWLVDASEGDQPLTLLSSSPPTYRLERSTAVARGLEGDLSLGWLAGETLARKAR